MTEVNDRQANPQDALNPGYIGFQFARALITSETHDDADTRERARYRMAKWDRVAEKLLSGEVSYGARQPFKDIPTWVTLEVVTGGFATGECLAGGPLQDHELNLLVDFTGVPEGEERRALNSFYLTPDGMPQLRQMMQTGCFEVTVPEEGALMVAVWLLDHGKGEEANELICQLLPFFSQLRFYPKPCINPQYAGSRVHIRSLNECMADLEHIQPNQKILAQRQAVNVWLPLHDRVVGLFLETVRDGRVCEAFPSDWSNKVMQLKQTFENACDQQSPPKRMTNRRKYYAQLRELLFRCADNPYELTEEEVSRVKLILDRYVVKRGTPESETCQQKRLDQRVDVKAPLYSELAGIMLKRLAMDTQVKGTEGLNDVDEKLIPVTKKEASSQVPVGTLFPDTIAHKVLRCLSDTAEVLIERGLITSGEMLAIVLPQMTSGIRALNINDSVLRALYAAIYRAFRKRRSLLLLNLERQVQLEELPWVAAIEPIRKTKLSGLEASRQAFTEVVQLTLTSFPHVILPNKLLQELSTLAQGANLRLPLVEEVAADIFMGEYSVKYTKAARLAADYLEGTFYARYYGIDKAQVRSLPLLTRQRRYRSWFNPKAPNEPLAQLCAARAGVELHSGGSSMNGMIIEQQQILTTQNLATVFETLNLKETLSKQLPQMAIRCFQWLCKRQQMKVEGYHARLIMLKHTAYAWRQMIFYMSCVEEDVLEVWLESVNEHFHQQPEVFRKRFDPAMRGLLKAAKGETLDRHSNQQGLKHFLGWSQKKHWLMP